MKIYKHLFFDIDHTLWDFELNSVHTLKEVYHTNQLPEKGILDFDDFNEVYHEINDKLWQRFRNGFLSREDLRWKRMWQTLVHYKVNDLALAKKMSEDYLDILPQQKALFPYAVEVLEYCAGKGYAMHLITNGFEETQYQKLRTASIDHFFQQMITSERAMSMKPHKGIFEFALKETGADVDSSLMVGDALDIDILGAREIGMDQVFFNPHQKPHDDRPTYEISCLSEMKRIV